MTAYRYAVIGCKLKQNADEGCNSRATVVQVLQDLFLSFIVCFILLLIAPLYCIQRHTREQLQNNP